MIFRVLAFLLGIAFVAFPFLPGSPRNALFAPIIGVAFLVYAMRGRAAEDESRSNAAQERDATRSGSAEASWLALYAANCRIAMRSAPFMIFAVLAGTATAWFVQLHFEVPRDRKVEVVPAIATLVMFALVLCRAVIATLGQGNRKGD